MRLAHLGHVANAFGSCVDNLRGPDSGPLTNGNENAAVYISESGLYEEVSGDPRHCLVFGAVGSK